MYDNTQNLPHLQYSPASAKKDLALRRVMLQKFSFARFPFVNLHKSSWEFYLIQHVQLFILCCFMYVRIHPASVQKCASKCHVPRCVKCIGVGMNNSYIKIF